MLAVILILLSYPVRADVELPRAKEKIVSWLITPDDKRIAAESAAHRQKLKDCGYDVVEVNGGSPTSLSSRLKTEKIQDGGLLLIDSHGLAFSNGEFVFTKSEAVTSFRSGKLKKDQAPASTIAVVGSEKPQKDQTQNEFEEITLFKGEELATALSTAGQKPRLWLDVCHAGFCPIPAECKVGTVCTYGTSSSEIVNVTQMLVDLMCSRKNDCVVWRQFDKNGDGLISPDEFDLELKARANHVSDTNLMNSIVPASGEARNDFEKRCQTLGGNAQASPLGSPFEVQYHTLDEHGFGKTIKMPLHSARKEETNRWKGEGTASKTAFVIPNQPVLKTDYSESYFARDVAEAHRIAKSKDFDPLDVKQLSQESFVKLSCVKSLAVFTLGGHKQSPNLTQFDLEAPNCAQNAGGEVHAPNGGVIHVEPRP